MPQTVKSILERTKLIHPTFVNFPKDTNITQNDAMLIIAFLQENNTTSIAFESGIITTFKAMEKFANQLQQTQDLQLNHISYPMDITPCSSKIAARFMTYSFLERGSGHEVTVSAPKHIEFLDTEVVFMGEGC